MEKLNEKELALLKEVFVAANVANDRKNAVLGMLQAGRDLNPEDSVDLQTGIITRKVKDLEVPF